MTRGHFSVKILIVEDNKDIAENIADYFEPLGHSLDFAADGLVGLHIAQAHDFDVIVLDLMMPRLDGMSLCRKLREDLHLDTPILMLTAKDQLDDKLEGFKSGADDYLVKPFSLKELEARLLALIKRGQSQNQETLLSVGDLEYEPGTYQASRANIALKLNPIQRKLLEFLMRNSERVVTRQELEQQIWGEEPPDKDILRTHVYSLRNVIDKPFETRLLHTVHGIGYRLSST